MKKVKLFIRESLKYNREMVIKVPEEMTETELNRLLDKVQRRADHVADLGYLFRDEGMKISEWPDDDMSSPFDVELEIGDYEFKEDKPNE